MSYEFESTVAGIPCVIRVTSYHAGRDGYISGPPEHCYPEEHPEAEVEVCDRRGRPAPWLERKLDAQGWARLEEEAIIRLEQERMDSHYDYD